VEEVRLVEILRAHGRLDYETKHAQPSQRFSTQVYVGMKCAVGAEVFQNLRRPPDEPLSNHDRAGRLCAIVNAASQPQRNHPAHPVPSPGGGFMSFVPGPETVRAAESEAAGWWCAVRALPPSLARWSSAVHARASGSRGSREQEHSGPASGGCGRHPCSCSWAPGAG